MQHKLVRREVDFVTPSAEHSTASHVSAQDCTLLQGPSLRAAVHKGAFDRGGCGAALWQACCSRCCAAQLRGDCRQLLQSLVDALREPGCALPASMVERVGARALDTALNAVKAKFVKAHGIV